jgi:pimeloyl-ACP methyl ester carboxylesterase
VGELRILSLHGYHGSAGALQRQMSAMTAALEARNIEFVHVDAPSLSEHDFGWWHSPARGWERTREWAAELFASERFDGVFGFSQGAALTGLLAGLRQRGEDGIAFDFALLVGGFVNDSPQLAELYRQQLTVPSVHVIGRTDGVIPPRMSRDLAARFADPVILEHAGGHVVPGDRSVVEGIAAFLERMAREPDSVRPNRR